MGRQHCNTQPLAEWHTDERRTSIRDAIVILLVSLTCSAAYVRGLGLYSDDWFFIEPLASNPDQSWAGLYRAIAELPFAAVRPGQILWFVAFHKWAPGNIGLTHLVNHALFAASVLLMHGVMRATPATRHGAYYVTLLYACLPTFSVAKMWYANHQAVVSLLLFALTWLAVTRVARGPGVRRWPWIVAAMLSAGIGNLFYELFSFTALALPLFVWWALGFRPRRMAAQPAMLATIGAIALGIAATSVFKLQYDYGFELPGTPGQLRQFAAQTAWLYIQAAETTFWTLGADLPRTAAGILGSPYLQPGSLAAPLVVLVIVAAREWLARGPASRAASPEAGPLFFAASGLVAFGLGYVPYLTNFLYSPKPWGEGNRGNMAAALGAAMLIYSLFRWASGRWPTIARTALVLFCVAGAFLQVAIGKTWVRAAVEQDRLLARFLRIAEGRLEDRGTVLLYRTCPYFGAGPVFPYGYDLEARLAVEAGYRNLRVDLVRPGMRIGPADLSTKPDRWGTKRYPYGALRIVDMGDGSVVRIDGPGDARRYFAARPFDGSITCEFDFGIGNPLY